MDKVSLRLLAILIGGAGLFAVLTKYSVPEVSMSYWEQNPFMVKRSEIERVLAWLFTLLALLGLLIRVVAEIFGDRIQERLHHRTFYFKFFTYGILLMGFIVCGLGRIGHLVARQFWSPKVVESQRELFTHTKFMIEHDGWEPQQYEHLARPDKTEERRKQNWERIDKNLAQMEKLFELPRAEDTAERRLETLKPYFQESPKQ